MAQRSLSQSSVAGIEDPQLDPAASAEARLNELAHDLRNSLHALQAGLILLNQKPMEDAERASVYRRMENERQESSRLLEQLLDLARRSIRG